MMRSDTKDSKRMDLGSKDRISSLPEPLICHILSFLPIEDSALTSVLSKRWRYLFAFRPNLDLVCSGNRTSIGEQPVYLWNFTGFVDRILRWQGDYVVNKFSLMCGSNVHPDYVRDWILNVLERGVSDLDLLVSLDEGNLPSKVFASKSLTRLRIESTNISGIDVEDVFLPKLKILYLHKVMLGKCDDCFDKITSGCHVLEELVLYDVYSNIWNRSVSSETLKRLTLWCIDYDKNPDTVSFDTPNVVYLEYSDYVSVKYPKVIFCSLIEADLNLAMTSDQSRDASYEHLVGDIRDFLVGICNVEILYLYAHTLEVLTFCCKSIPVFNNLSHLTIHTDWEVGWESLPALLNNCPNLETLVFEGLHHKYTLKCGVVDGCLCKYSGETLTCLSSSPVKVLRILRFGDCGIDSQIDLIKHFLETMPRLEQLLIHCDASVDEDVIEELIQFQMLPTVASPNCEIQFFY